MSNTPRGAPELVSAQALPETTVNEQIRRTEAGAGRYVVADRVTAPPGSCVDGANYIIIATATGAFAGKEGQIAQAVGTNAASGWYYRIPGTVDEGITAYVQDEDVDYRWSGAAWASIGAGTGTVSTVSVASANGFAGSVANATSTPAITLTTTITGVLKGNGTAVSAATAGSDYYNPGGTDVAVVDGGTGSSTAAGARTNLGAAPATPSIQSVSSSATVTPTFADDQVIITAQAAGLTLANPTGTAVDGWGMAIRIKDNGTARSITFGSQYRAIGVTMPTTTVISKTLYLGMIFNNADTKWDVVAVAQEA